jgi:alpha-1,3-fucosyltransferase
MKFKSICTKRLIKYQVRLNAMSIRLVLKRNRKLLTFVFALILCGFVYYSNYDIVAEIHKRELKAVQVWTPKFNSKTWDFDELAEKPFESCPERRCYAFWSRQTLPHEASDGVLVHASDLNYMPSRQAYKRNPKQLWSLTSTESQAHSFRSNRFDLTELDDWFNLTLTFKPDSDCVIDYRQFKDWKTMYRVPWYLNAFRDYYQRISSLDDYKRRLGIYIGGWARDGPKRASILWFTSNPGSVGKRDDYVLEMAKYIDIDIYGKSSEYKNKFPNYKQDPCINKHDDAKETCYMSLFESYKFYLSFENSLCNGYISEKLWKLYTPEFLFNVNIVPIVRGARDTDYARVMYSKKAYINVDRFDSPRGLVTFLKSLEEDDSAYASFFSWKLELFDIFEKQSKVAEKRRERFEDDFCTFKESPFCLMCARLHDKKFMSSTTNRVYKISEWFNPKTECWDEGNKPYSAPINIFGDGYFH